MTTTTTLSRRRRLALLLGLAVPLALPACSGGSNERAEVQSSADPAAQEETTSTEAREPSDREAGSGTEDGSTTTSKASNEDSTEGGEDEVLGSTTGNHPADPNDDTPVPLRLDVNRVERLPGDVIEVRFTITNEGETATYELWNTLSGAVSGYDVGGAALVDALNDKRYLTLYDSEGTCLCTGGNSDLAAAPGGSIEAYVQITAPPEDVTEVGFTMPGFAPINGLALP